jgi:hypothetical protein
MKKGSKQKENYFTSAKRKMEAKAKIMAQSITTEATLTPMFQMALLSLDGRYCSITFTQTNKDGIAYNFPHTTYSSLVIRKLSITGRMLLRWCGFRHCGETQ